jgi:ATP-binding cassette subfamily D (ALD) long-chain fatty acid import protein
MEAMSSSIQDLFELTNRVGKLSGYAKRVSALLCGLEDRKPILEDKMDQLCKPTFRKGTDLTFENVSVFKPDGTMLVKDLNFTMKRGERVLITGGNGCGKSSLFRVIRKLWPLVRGTITMPEEKDIYFLTQVNFVPIGTLRDLVIYPHSAEEAKANGRTDADVLEVLKWARVSPEVIEDGRAELQFTIEGEVIRPKVDDFRDWQKDLSPGQKQKIAFARLFYHAPSFVVLDECTNGISPDVEQELYNRCTELNLAIFSISHKIELKEFHDRELHYYGDADGSWKMFSCEETRGKIVGSMSQGLIDC